MSIKIHPTALIERDVHIGHGTAIWDNVHIRHSTTIGENCIIGEKTHIAYAVVIGNCVKVNAFVYIPTGVTLEDGVMVSAGTVFTNDRFPRAATGDLMELRPSEPDETTLLTRVGRGATIGANCTVGCGLTIGSYAMIGMGSVVTRSVPDYHLSFGNPARSVGVVCACGTVLAYFDDLDDGDAAVISCDRCGESYEISACTVTRLATVS